MSTTVSISLVLILCNFIFSWMGFRNASFFDRYAFEVDKILINKEYYRLLTSGFLHVNWTHLIFNMLSLYLFSSGIEYHLGEFSYLLIYFASLIGGDLFSLFIHRNHGDYSSVGASGAINGIIFASIALFPGFGLRFFGLPFTIPGWLYALAFTLYSIYGIRSKRENIGHEAHLGGALIGMLLALVFVPSALFRNYVPILLVLVPSVIFIYIIVTRPHFLYVDNFFFKKHQYHSIDEKYNSEKVELQREIDRILEKIHVRGIDSLSKKEKQLLDDFSRKR